MEEQFTENNRADVDRMHELYSDDREAYIAQGIPEIDPEESARSVRETVEAHTYRYLGAPVWRTFFERMFMLVGTE